MPSPEQFYQPRALEAPPSDYDKLGALPPISLRMEQVVMQLAAAHHVDLSQKGAKLKLDVPNQKQRWLIANIDGVRIGVIRCQVDEENRLSPDLDMVFAISAAGWEPQEIIHTPAVWEGYTKAMQAIGKPVEDAEGNFNFVTFTDHIAQAIEQAGYDN